MIKQPYLDEVLLKYGARVYSKYTLPSEISAVYIGRGSIFGNPFKTMVNKTQQSRIDNCILFRHYLKDKIDNDPGFALSVQELDDKTVVCYCSNGTTSTDTGARYCHGHVLLAAARYLTLSKGT